MQESYLQNHTKLNSKFLPYLKAKRPKPTDSTLLHLKQPTEQSVMLELQDIDQSLNSKNLNYRNGYLFSTQINEKVINDLHMLVKKKNAMIMEEGFALGSLLTNNTHHEHHQSDSKESKRLSNKLETLNSRIVKLSLQNVYDYDLRKYMQLMKNNRSKWSLFKRVNEQSESKFQSSYAESSTKKLQTISKMDSSKNESAYNSPSVNSPSISAVLKTNALSKQSESKSQQTTLSPSSKMDKTAQVTNHSNERIHKSKQKYLKKKMLTEISEATNPEQEVNQVSKYDIKNMLKKEKNTLIFVWIPPATYPQFHGMFTYVVTKKITICKLKKYFFFKRSLNERFFKSAIEEISIRQDRYIEGIELVVSKSDFSKVYEPIGWKMKAIESMDHLRIRYSRQAI